MASNWDTNSYDWTKNAANTWGGGSAPSFNWGSVPSSNFSSNFSVDWGNKFDLPGLSGTGGLATPQPPIQIGRGFSGSTPSYEAKRSTDWSTLGKEALNLAKNWSSLSGSGKRQGVTGYAGEGGTERQLSPSLRLLEGGRRVTQTQEQRGNASGIGGAIGTIAGIGASFIPGVGAGIVPFLPTIGGTVGSGIGSLFG